MREVIPVASTGFSVALVVYAATCSRDARVGSLFCVGVEAGPNT